MKNGMKLLKENKYGEILEHLHKIPYNILFARAVLESKTSGKVFVDNIDKPKTIFISTLYGMSLLLGDTENLEFNTSLTDYMLNTDGNRQRAEWLQVYPEKWNDKLKELLNGKIINYLKISNEYSKSQLEILIEKYKKSHLIQWNRVNFEYKNINKVVNLESKYNIKLIDSHIYDRIEGTVIPKYFWKSKEDFLSYGVGYALMEGKDIVSIAFSSWKSENKLEIGVETSVKYRCKDFATAVCVAMLDYCKTNKYLPIWACKRENIGSYMLAKSLGFEESFILPYYEMVK
ncbi:GNAT family N-acetyltransferase [Clostridium sp. WILCCON 0269]|uniref:GNAT family N-acetyltransferase n=1 Tax=Candidatus Clostridium eludens TaxID=3381663 RepID=A0ABW8SR15_9CLOT